MTFLDFKKLIENMAYEEETNLHKIYDLIYFYFSKIGIIEYAPNYYYVVRASKNNVNEIFTNSQRCSYNPNSKKIPLQRCNYPEQQVFYCSMFTDTDDSSTSFTCIMETALEDVKNKDLLESYYTLSRWNLTRPLKLCILPFTYRNTKKNKDFSVMRNKLKKDLRNNNKRDEILTALEYISKVFCKRNDKKKYYKISSSFFNYLIYSDLFKDKQYDGLAYPSANTGGAGMNVALKKSVIDNKILEFYGAMTYRLRKDIDNKKNIKIFPCSDFVTPDSSGKFMFNMFDPFRLTETD
jgi:hypothetical protein